MSNRVDPWGRIFVTPERNYLMGNRDFGDAWIASTPKQCGGSEWPKQQ